ncbi:hypothetical protein [Nitrosopumilus sp.]|uniref:hypothetical protein n=1 Tax=Nitrosopumilus sp. TaxID=2024843 RepID=UPI00292E8D00|nr:hypothetical protein [Nitrosopumilus sp.]
MNYTKYLNCNDCKKSGLYCVPHRKEIEMKLKRQELLKTLQIRDVQSPLYKKSIRNLLESYVQWNA